MGSASCKNSKSATPAAKNEEAKKITIGVFGLDDAGKTTAVKAIEGAPIKESEPTIGTDKLMVPYPAAGKGKSKSKERIEMIDVGGGKRSRDRTWAECYDKVHGFIFVIDASNKTRMGENKTTLNELLDNNKLQDKPILILANKQDKKNAIKDEDYLKDKLEIDDLKRKHRIEFCTAIGKDKGKADDAIRQGFSWLIEEIENDYKKLNGRVNKTKTPTGSKDPLSTKKPRGRLQSDQSDMDDDIVYGQNRQKSSSTPPPSYRGLDTRTSQNLSSRLPQLDINKSKRKTSGYNTYSDNDDDGKGVTNRSFSRPNATAPMFDRTNRAITPPLSSAAATADFNKKKKVVGTTGVGAYDLPTNKSTSNEPKPFRSSYETFPDDIPWKSSSIRSTKPDSTLPPKSYMKPPTITDPLKRSVSPLVRDSKPITSTLSKPGKASDDDEFGFKYGSLSNDKSKPSYPPINRMKDDDSFKYPSTSSTSKPLTNLRKPSSGIHGLDDDDLYGQKTPPTIRRSNFPSSATAATPTTTATKKANRYDDNSDNDNDYYKKPTTNTTKRFDSDEDDNRNKSKPYDRFKTNDDPYGTPSKSFSSKPKSRFGNDDDDDDDKYKPASKTRPKISDDDDDLPSSSKYDTRPKYGTDYPTSSLSKPVSRLKQDDNDRPSSPYRSTTLPKYGEDNRSTSLSRLNNNDKSRASPAAKPSTHSKFSDDEDDRQTSKWKPSTYSKFDEDDDDDRRPTSLSKVPSRSKLNEYDDDDRPFSSKKPSSSRFDDDDRPTTSSKAPSRSRFDDDDDDRRPGTLAKAPSRSKFDDDDDDDRRPGTLTKVPSRSKFDDDDDDLPMSSSKASTSKFGTNGARSDYSSANRFRTNPYSDY